MNIIVQKYGGSSLKNKEIMEKVCTRTEKYLKENVKLIIVVSAQGKTTDNLISLSKEYSKKQDKLSLDMLLSTGETTSCSLLSLMLNDRGIKAIPLNGFQAGIITDSNFGEAKILNIYKECILEKFKKYDVIVITGFQGVNKFGEITTLGRGGSDLSATAIASNLNAKLCEIYSDVDGIFSSDPRLVDNTKLINSISYDEMIEAASNGAKVMHNRSVMVAKDSNLEIDVKNTSNLNDDKKTKICDKLEETIENNNVKIISKKDDLSKITIVGKMMVSSNYITKKIYDACNEINAKIYMITFSEISISIIVDTAVCDKLMNLLHKRIILDDK